MEAEVRGTLRETDIRPDELRGGARLAQEQDLRWLLSKRSEFVEVSCPACGSSTSTEKFTKNTLVYEECFDCRTVYVSPRPTPEILAEFYAQSKNYAYWNEHIFPASEDVRRERIFRPRAQRIKDLVERYDDVGTRLLMDIGAGFGTFCEEMKVFGLFRYVVALEPMPDLATTCRERGLVVIEKPFEQVEANNANVITAFEVIEHLFDPVRFVRHCRRPLTEGGLLVLTCPNIRGFETAILGTASSTIDHEHLNYFHPMSIRYLLEQCGFEVLEVATPGQLDVELVYKGMMGMEIDSFLRRLVMSERRGDEFQQFLADNMLSSHMWVVARRMA